MILGKKENIDLVKNATAYDKTVLVSYESIENVSEQFDVLISKIEFNPKTIDTLFTDVGHGNYYPKPPLFYALANAAGIRGCGITSTTPIFETVDISSRDMTDVPVLTKMITGYSTTKQAESRELDGSWSAPPASTNDYNSWVGCNQMWSKEESFSSGYTKKGSWKYDTKWKRKAHFWDELKAAQTKSSTRAYCKCIREILGMHTGFKSVDLKCGYFIVSKIVTSKNVLAREAAMRLENLRNKKTSTPNILFSEPEIEPIIEPEQKSINAEMSEGKNISELQEIEEFTLLNIFEKYKTINVIPENLGATVDAMIKWLKSEKEPEKNKIYWTKAVEHLKTIEKDLGEIKTHHKFY